MSCDDKLFDYHPGKTLNRLGCAISRIEYERASINEGFSHKLRALG